MALVQKFVCKLNAFHVTMVCYESWVVPAGVPSALADVLGAELGPIIDLVTQEGGFV